MKLLNRESTRHLWTGVALTFVLGVLLWFSTAATRVSEEIQQAQMTQEQKQEIITALRNHGVRYPCPRCGSNNFTLLDGYFKHELQLDFLQTVIGGTAVPTVATVCERCGFVSQHALGVLGLLHSSKGNQ